MFKTLKNLYRRNKITESGLRKSVEDGIITKEQYTEITGKEY